MAFLDALADWTDSDVAQYELGRAIGLFGERSFQQAKGVFWTDNPLGDGLRNALLALTDGRVLDHRDEPDDQFRWARRDG